MVNRAKRPEIFEILDLVKQQKAKGRKIEILRKYDNVALRDICRGYYDDRVQWNLPEGSPPYTPNLPESVPSTLLKKNVMFKHFVKGSTGDTLTSVKRESIFISLLESVHPADAKVLILMINKKPMTGLTKSVIQEAFPGLIPD